MQQPFEEIKQAYPDEWLILGNPVMSDDGQRILAADLLYHSPDKRELAYMDKPLMKKYHHRAYRFNRVTKRPTQRMWINLQAVEMPPIPPDAEPIKSKYAYSDEV